MITIVAGARPQFIKVAAIIRALQGQHPYQLIHTGQHYDDNLSAIMFRDLEIPQPDVDLGVGSGTHGAQTAAMLAGIEQVLGHHNPELVLVCGDTNSTLAGALAAAKLGIPVAHLEAGLRSYNKKMPEEINRLLTDHLSDLLFCPSQNSVENLAHEGIKKGVHLVGDVMADALAYALPRALQQSTVLETHRLEESNYYLVTVHRSENTDNPIRLQGLITAFKRLEGQVIFPAHPRTAKAIKQHGLLDDSTGQNESGEVTIIEPLGYLDMLRIATSANMILTDSGGLQKEAYWLGIPCITLRDETEWVETVESGWNILAGFDPERITHAVNTFQRPSERKALYGDCRAAERCVAIMIGGKASTVH